MNLTLSRCGYIIIWDCQNIEHQIDEKKGERKETAHKGMMACCYDVRKRYWAEEPSLEKVWLGCLTYASDLVAVPLKYFWVVMPGILAFATYRGMMSLVSETFVVHNSWTRYVHLILIK